MPRDDSCHIVLAVHALLAAVFIVAGCARPYDVSFDLGSDPIPLDSEMVRIIRTLDALGVSESGPIGTWPVTRRQAARHALEAGDAMLPISGVLAGRLDEFTSSLRPELSGDVRQGGMDYVQFTVADGLPDFRSTNAFGVLASEDRTFTITSRAVVHLGKYAFFTLRPEFEWSERVSDGGDFKSRFIEANVRLFAGRWEIEYGTDSMWWGPGVHGSLLMSNNAPPFKGMVKITNHEPVIFPLFKCPAYFTLFWTKLGADRADFASPDLGGMRLELRLRPTVTLGFSRTAIFGGEGRPNVDFGTILDILFARNENTPEQPGDQRAAIDLTWRLHSDVQPLQLYLEIAGEDEAGGVFMAEALLAGVYLPRIGPLAQLGVRLEFARTSSRANWYDHGLYTDGYTLEDLIIGHHMGADARDVYFAIEYKAGPDLSIDVFFNWEKHLLSGPVTEEKTEFGVRTDWQFSDRRSVGVEYVHQQWDNLDFVQGNGAAAWRVAMSFRTRW